MENKLDIKDVITIALALFSIIISTYFFLVTSSEKITNQTIIIFIGILIVLILMVIFYYLLSKWTNVINKVYQNKKEINEIKRDLNYKDLYVKVGIIEKMIKNKKGQAIDPRIIFWIVLAILLYLFLKSVGVFP